MAFGEGGIQQEIPGSAKTLNPSDMQSRGSDFSRIDFLCVSHFTPSGFTWSDSQFFVNLSSVSDRKDPNEPGLAIDFMDDRAY